MRDTVPRELTQHELIGLRARVVRARDPNQMGLEGVLADETRNTFLVQTREGPRRVPKRGLELEVSADPATGSRAGGEPAVRLQCERLVGRPEDRIKRNAPKGGRHRERRGRKGNSRTGGTTTAGSPGGGAHADIER